jgi:hypothetical protein
MSNKIIKKPNYSDYDLVSEKQSLKNYLSENSLIVDIRLFESIEIGDIIEVYSFPENKQLYSNSEFRKLCSYNTEQMLTIPFPTLFYREQDVHMQLMNRAAEVCNLKMGLYSWEVVRHELVESLHPRKRTFEMAVKTICPLFQINNQTSAIGFVSTSIVEFIFEWNKDIA